MVDHSVEGRTGRKQVVGLEGSMGWGQEQCGELCVQRLLSCTLELRPSLCFLNYYCICVCACMCMHKCEHHNKYVKVTGQLVGIGFFFLQWVPGIKLRSLGLVVNTPTHKVISLVLPFLTLSC